MLHAYLLAHRNNLLNKNNAEIVHCNQAYSADLISKIYEFICKHYLGSEIIDRINVSFGCSP